MNYASLLAILLLISIAIPYSFGNHRLGVPWPISFIGGICLGWSFGTIVVRLLIALGIS